MRFCLLSVSLATLVGSGGAALQACLWTPRRHLGSSRPVVHEAQTRPKKAPSQEPNDGDDDDAWVSLGQGSLIELLLETH